MERESQNGAYYEGKVMTDEQMEMLRKQIAVYAAICEQLVLLHNSLSSHDPLSVGRLSGNPYFDPLVSSSSAQRMATRHRWTPTATQLQILEKIYDEGNGTPNKQKIKDIATELGKHGQITETNVYNWFQNRRARSKRKQLHRRETESVTGTGTAVAVAIVAAAEEEEEENGGEKWRRSGSMESYEHILFPSPDLGIEHLLGKAGAPGEVDSFMQAEG